AGRDRARSVPDRFPGADGRRRTAQRAGAARRPGSSARARWPGQWPPRVRPAGRPRTVPGEGDPGAARAACRRRRGQDHVRGARAPGADPAGAAGRAFRRWQPDQPRRPVRHRPRAPGRAGRRTAAPAAQRRLAGRRVPAGGVAAQHATAGRREAEQAARAGRRPGGLSMFDRLARVRVLEGFSAEALPVDRLVAENLPTVLPGLARDWPLVQAGLESPQAAMALMRASYNGRPVQYNWGEPATAGRPFYNGDFPALNCQVRRGTLDEVLDGLASHLDDPAPPTYYVASLLVDYCLPALREHNDLGLGRHGVSAPPSIWIGNRVTAACHYDAPNNIACCAVGRRRFTELPPEQVHNLYPGPLQPTPGGQAVSVVDFDAPDLERFPRFASAIEAGQTVVLEPGDAIFIPSLWWHHVQGLDPFTVLVNY